MYKNVTNEKLQNEMVTEVSLLKRCAVASSQASHERKPLSAMAWSPANLKRKPLSAVAWSPTSHRRRSPHFLTPWHGLRPTTKESL